MQNTFRFLSFGKRGKHPIYDFIVICGFTVGIAATLLIYLWVDSETHYEACHTDSQRTYRVLSLSKNGTSIQKSAASYPALAENLKKDYARIVQAASLAYSSEDSPLYEEGGQRKIEARSLRVNDDFFAIFDGFPFLEGNVQTALNTPNSVVLSEHTAKKLFGDNPALGKTLISDKYVKETYTVTGVLHIPHDTHIHFGYILPGRHEGPWAYANDFRLTSHVHTYIKLAENASIDEAFVESIRDYITAHTGKSDKLLFQPLGNIHLYSDYEPSLYDRNISHYKYVWIFSLLAFLIIFMASFNFAALETARSTEKYKEMGVRKVNGATRGQLIGYGLRQSLWQALLSGVLAYGVVLLCLPLVNQHLYTDLHPPFSIGFWLKFLLFLFAVGGIAGLYPAIYAASFQPTSLFQGRTATSPRKYLIEALVLVQFVIALGFMMGTTMVVRQLNYMQNKDLGFNHADVLVVPTGLWYDNRDFKNELLKHPYILSVTASTYAPLDYHWQTAYAIRHKGECDSISVTRVCVDEDFAKTYGLEVVKGEFLNITYADYWKEVSKEDDELLSIPMVINETAEKLMGFENPIGQRVGHNVIVGVVKDFHFRPLHHVIGPMILVNDPENIMTVNIKMVSKDRAGTLAYIREIYAKYRDQRAFTYAFFDEMLKAEYRDEIRLRNLMFLFSLMAVFMAFLGIMGMSLFFIRRRTKEIGIRKINGAGVMEVMLLLNKEFVWTVLIAFIIASPIAYYAMSKWLENFAYKTALSWWIFVLAGVLALAIALFTVSWQSWRAATRNPVEALRYE
ncbi:MAG: hypothetical protein CSA95_02725 [Bacteroidetes bacterium]|nr:MAG: hypothetical protein CSA95_02725 [Bacteroidota bacterium]